MFKHDRIARAAAETGGWIRYYQRELLPLTGGP
jgi:hypothetical protein